MASDRVVIKLEERARQVARETSPRGDTASSVDAIVQAFAERYGAECGYLGPGHRWITRARKRRIQDSTESVFALIRKFVLQAVSGTKDGCGTATAACVTGDATGASLATAAAA